MERVTVAIPTWMNLPYLELCVRSIREHSAVEHEIVVHVNEAHAPTQEFLRREGLPFTCTAENVGVSGVNRAVSAHGATDWVYFLNDDMVCLPGWDTALLGFVGDRGLDYACSVAVEPCGWARGKCAVRGDYGRGIPGFREDELLADCESMKRPGAVVGGAWPPHLMSRGLWDSMGGFTADYDRFGGIGTDADLAWRLRKRWVPTPAVRASLVYHFTTRTTRRIPSGGLAGERDAIFRDRHGIDRRAAMRSLGRGKEWKA